MLNELNLQLQGKEKTMVNMITLVNAFKRKMQHLSSKLQRLDLGNIQISHQSWRSHGRHLRNLTAYAAQSRLKIVYSICIPRFDHGLGIMTGITPINPMMAGISLVPPPPVPTELSASKEIIHCNSCTLFPQNPNLPPPSTRERPPGCKTVFVGGLPENATEEIIREVFNQCGEITAIRKSKKNFCHIRFTEEFMVDKAIYLSGYRMRIGSSTDKKDSGRLHVDFAQARDDFYEWECKQRLLAREERHRRKIEEERLRPPSPPPIMHFSDHEAGLLAEKLKGNYI
ncbi:ENOX1 protein, partial [Polypterus senegalus]